MTNIKIEDFQQQAIDLIKKFEGLSLTPYLCSANKSTIGYGHVILPNERYIKITEAEAEEILNQDLQKFFKEYIKYVKVELNQNQHASLFSLMFNIGIRAFAKSTLLKYINENANESDIKKEFLRWKFVNKVESKGLLNRRLLEWEIYSK